MFTPPRPRPLITEPRHTCPGGCGRQIAQSLLACAYHWKQLPADVQRQVWETWRSRQQHPEDDRLVRAHLAAVAKASAYLREHQEVSRHG